MKVVAICSWFDEQPEFLEELVRSLDGVADHLVAVDGCYATWPRADERFLSPPEQAATIRKTAKEIGIGLTLRKPRKPWPNNEVEKRTYCFGVAEQVTTPNDWYFILDSDSYVAEAKDGWREQLARTRYNAAEIALLNRGGDRESTSFLRCFFRAFRGMRVGNVHYHFLADINGRPTYLWGKPVDGEPLEPCLDLRTYMWVVHRRDHRPAARNKDAETWYERRNREKLEWIEQPVVEKKKRGNVWVDAAP